MLARCFPRPASLLRLGTTLSRHAVMAGVTAQQAQSLGKQNGKRAFNEGKRHFKKNKRQKTEAQIFDGSNEQVLVRDVQTLLQRLKIDGKPDGTAEQADQDPFSLPELFTEVEVTIEELSSTGDGLAILPDSSQVAVVPFTVPGDKVVAKLIRHDQQHPYTITDFVKVVEGGATREDANIRCKYFARCSGCQFQMMHFHDQERHKQRIIEKAYTNFSGLASDSVPAVGKTISSHMHYGYRTKLTPHFDGPPGGRRDRRQGNKPSWDGVPNIGFMLKGTRKTMDIEDCPIGTDAVRKGMKQERARVAKELDSYSRGATLLLREHTTLVEKDNPSMRGQGLKSENAQNVREEARAGQNADTKTDYPKDTIIEDDHGLNFQLKSCVTDQNAVTTEYVGSHRFDNPAGAFFQNNNSILGTFVYHVKSHMLGGPPTRERSTTAIPNPDGITHLVDAYCGSGLFTVCLSDQFQTSIGIDISDKSIQFARTNARLNNIPEDRASFLAGDAKDIFAHVRSFPPDRTAVVIDPSRKGCDEPFLNQLLEFAPKRVCYVSCNVHTQARDVGVLCGEERGKYVLEALQGFDFFPQTAHVEAVAILRRKDGVDGGKGYGEVDARKTDRTTSPTTSQGGAKGSSRGSPRRSRSPAPGRPENRVDEDALMSGAVDGYVKIGQQGREAGEGESTAAERQGRNADEGTSVTT